MQTESKKTSSLDKLRNAFSHFTLFLTLGFGAVTTLTLIEEPSRTLQPTFATTTVRGPASVTTVSSIATKPFMATLDIGCDNLEGHKTVSEHVRIKSQACGFDLQSATVVKNVSNGFSATVFPQGTGFTTDYLALNQGENKIVIENTVNGETKTRSVTVLRE